MWRPLRRRPTCIQGSGLQQNRVFQHAGRPTECVMTDEIRGTVNILQTVWAILCSGYCICVGAMTGPLKVSMKVKHECPVVFCGAGIHFWVLPLENHIRVLWAASVWKSGEKKEHVRQGNEPGAGGWTLYAARAPRRAELLPSPVLAAEHNTSRAGAAHNASVKTLDFLCKFSKIKGRLPRLLIWELFIPSLLIFYPHLVVLFFSCLFLSSPTVAKKSQQKEQS